MESSVNSTTAPETTRYSPDPTEDRDPHVAAYDDWHQSIEHYEYGTEGIDSTESVDAFRSVVAIETWMIANPPESVDGTIALLKMMSEPSYGRHKHLHYATADQALKGVIDILGGVER